MSTSKLKVAVIGLGNIGKVVAVNLVKSNREIIVATRTIDDAHTIAAALGPLAKAAEVSDAIRQAQIIILSVGFNTIKELLFQYAEELRGKIVVDPSNPIAPDNKGGFKKIIEEAASAGEINASFLPPDVTLAKALGTLGAASLEHAAFRKPEEAVLFYATDNESINHDIETLIRDVGFEPSRIGGINQSIRIEVFGELHEFGALGKTITKSESKAIVA